AERILEGPLPWARMRAAYSLLRLCEQHGVGRVEAVCQSALAFDVIDVKRLKRMLKAATRPPKAPDSERRGTVTQLTLPRFARDNKHFETRSHRRTTRRIRNEQLVSSRPRAGQLAEATQAWTSRRYAPRPPGASRQAGLSYEQLLLLVLSDEIQRRDSTAAERRAPQAELDTKMRLECFDKSANVSYDKRLL